MLCNATGRDLFINTPMIVRDWDPNDTTSYVYKLASLQGWPCQGARSVFFRNSGKLPHQSQ